MISTWGVFYWVPPFKETPNVFRLQDIFKSRFQTDSSNISIPHNPPASALGAPVPCAQPRSNMPCYDMSTKICASFNSFELHVTKKVVPKVSIQVCIYIYINIQQFIYTMQADYIEYSCASSNFKPPAAKNLTSDTTHWVDLTIQNSTTSTSNSPLPRETASEHNNGPRCVEEGWNEAGNRTLLKTNDMVDELFFWKWSERLTRRRMHVNRNVMFVYMSFNGKYNVNT